MHQEYTFIVGQHTTISEQFWFKSQQKVKGCKGQYENILNQDMTWSQ